MDMNTPDTEVEIEQNAETGEVITANGVRLTPGTEWTEALQVEVMDGYLHLAEMRHFAKDPVAHMEEMREHWQKLQDFISTLLSSRDTYWKEREAEAYELGRKHEREMLVEYLNKTRTEAIKDYDDYCIDGFLRDFNESIVDFPMCVDCGVKVEKHEAQCGNCRIQL